MIARRDFLAAAAGMAAAAAAPVRVVADPAPVAASDYGQQLEAARAAGDVTGASFAYWDGRSMHTAVAGVRNSATGDPVTVDTVMHVGSITKVMNTALMLQLVDEGKVALDHPISKYLPELRLREAGALKRITCGMLVNHTSGIDCDWLPDHGPDQERVVDAIGRCAELGQLFAPGEMASYNNMAFVIAGYLVQKLRQDSWYTVVKKRIYEPLELHHALVDPLEVARFRASIGSRVDPKTGKLAQASRPFLSPSFAPAGSTQMTSAADLVTQARALLNGGSGPNGARILSAASAALMMQPTAEFVPMVTSTTKIGLGWMVLPGGVLYHGGGGQGVSSHLYAHPASGRAVALLTNSDRWHAFAPVLDPLVESWSGIKKVFAKRWDGPVDWQRYEGTYESNLQRVDVLGQGTEIELRMRQKLSVYDDAIEKGGNFPPLRLNPTGEDSFGDTSGRAGTEIRFARPGADGRMRFLAMGNRLMVRTS